MLGGRRRPETRPRHPINKIKFRREGRDAMTVASNMLAPTAADSGAGRDAVPVDRIPRDYNFAADILALNLDAGRAEKAAYIDPRGSWTYGQLADRVARFGDALRKLGIQREDRIFLCLSDTIDWPTA